ncbi:MAG: hypothetical protein HY011_07160 [Acidobacteria bacterium]|nr:hypothetical protein [Acidobacteriota bacterium]
MTIQTLTKSFYGFVGTLLLLAGGTVLLLRTGLLPEALQSLIFNVGRGDLNAVHILQEFSALLVFAGLMTFWAIRHYEQSRPFHWALTTFWGLLALVHWVDARGDFKSVAGPLINTIPFALFVLVGLLRQRVEKQVA